MNNFVESLDLNVSEGYWPLPALCAIFEECCWAFMYKGFKAELVPQGELLSGKLDVDSVTVQHQSSQALLTET